MIVPKKNKARRRRPKQDKGIYITDEAWEAARKSITAQNKNVIMLPPGRKTDDSPPRWWQYPQTWNLPEDSGAETQSTATENPADP